MRTKLLNKFFFCVITKFKRIIRYRQNRIDGPKLKAPTQQEKKSSKNL